MSKTTPGRLRVAIIGLGGAGATMHVPALKRLHDVVVVATFDTDPAKRMPGVQAASTMREAIESADAVIVATPPAAHAEAAIAAIQAGRHCYVEKPVGGTGPAASAIAAAARDAGVVCQPGFAYRHHPGWRRIRTAVDAGRFTAPFRFEGHFSWRAGATVPAAGDLGIHHVDLALWLTGSRATDVSVDDGSTLRVGFDDGSTLQGTYGTTENSDRLSVEDAAGARVEFTRLPRYRLTQSGVRLPRPGRDDAGILRARLSPGWERSFEYALRHFVAACRGTVKADPQSSECIERAEIYARIIAAATQSQTGDRS